MRWKMFACLLFITGLVFPFEREEILLFSSYFDSNVVEIQKTMHFLGTNEEENIKRGILYLAMAVKEPPVEKASLKALQILKQFEKKNVNEVVKAYIAMSYALGGRDDNNPVMKLNYVNKSIKLFNDVVEAYPNDWYIRFLRGQCFAGLPGMFHVADKAESDFLFLQKMDEERRQSLPPTLVVSVYYYLGEFAKSKREINRAIAFYKKAIEIAEAKGIKNDSYKKAKARIQLLED